MNRRRFVGTLSALGLGGTLLPGALAAVAPDAETITVEMLETALSISGLSFPKQELESILDRLNGDDGPLKSYQALRERDLGNDVAPALWFHPLPAGKALPKITSRMRISAATVERPATDQELAFLPVTHLSKLVASRQVKPSELTQLYLERLKRYDPTLHCVVSLTEELALRQARQADEEIAAGKYRGPLHGIPWGAKDLLAVKGYPTTWGASPYKDQTFDLNSTVYEKLTEAGAILVAKLTLGALASGDRWFGGRTRNPWNTEQGSSGSSAGPGSSTAAGLVGFSIGTETRGSIISPSTRNGVTGLRPTYGMVSRYGAMALSWSMDKIGPMCRTAEDCALVFDAIRGPDDRDVSVFDVGFNWDSTRDVRSLKVGYLASAVEDPIPDNPDNPERAAQARTTQEHTRVSLDVLRALGVRLERFTLPDLGHEHIGFILTTEAAAAFDALGREGRDNSMRAEPESSRWPDTFRAARLIPAVEYIRANQLRTKIIQELDEALGELDCFVGSDLGLTNLTGHPEVSVPQGFHEGSPTSLRFTGKLFGEAEILLLAHAFQGASEFHTKRPPI